MFKVLIGVVLKLYLLITKDSLWSKAWGKTFFAMRNTLDRSYRDRHLNGQKILPIVVKKLIVKKCLLLITTEWSQLLAVKWLTLKRRNVTNLKNKFWIAALDFPKSVHLF